jgi:DNA-binding XRE family transcriptional regulator
MARNNFKNLRADLADRVGEDRVAAAEQAERDRYELEQLALGDIRRARAMTQTQLAKALGVSQAQVSRIEGQSDLFLSTLASYIEAMGGELNLVAAFPDDKRVAVSIGDLAETSPPPPTAVYGTKSAAMKAATSVATKAKSATTGRMSTRAGKRSKSSR